MKTRADAAVTFGFFADRAAHDRAVELVLSQRLLHVHRRDHDQLDFLDFFLAEALFFQPQVDHRFRVGAEGVDADLLADQVFGRLDRAVFRDVEAGVGLGVGAELADHRFDRAARGDQFDDRAGEGAADVGLVGGDGLDAFRPDR